MDIAPRHDKFGDVLRAAGRTHTLTCPHARAYEERAGTASHGPRLGSLIKRAPAIAHTPAVHHRKKAMDNLPHRKPRPERPARDDEAPTSYADQVGFLLELAEHAVALQAAADAAIRACGAEGTIPDEVAVRTGQLLRGYSQLHHLLDGLDADPDLAQVRSDLLGQLSYHLHMLRDAGDLVFSGRSAAETDRFRRELADGLGSHATGLVRLRDALTARQAAMS